MNSKDIKIAIIGLGYVGLPLAVAFAEKYRVVGFDINSKRIEELQKGHDHTLELSDEQLEAARNNKIIYSDNIEDIESCNIYIVTVPTPIDESHRPDLTPLTSSSEIVGKVIKRDDVVIYESTVYPGVTEDVCIPVIEK